MLYFVIIKSVLLGCFMCLAVVILVRQFQIVFYCFYIDPIILLVVLFYICLGASIGYEKRSDCVAFVSVKT